VEITANCFRGFQRVSQVTGFHGQNSASRREAREVPCLVGRIDVIDDVVTQLRQQLHLAVLALEAAGQRGVVVVVVAGHGGGGGGGGDLR
jgi:hypothetical protein